jgi:hypothetical protein
MSQTCQRQTSPIFNQAPLSRSLLQPAVDLFPQEREVDRLAIGVGIAVQARKLRMTQMKQRLVIAGFHIDLRLCLDAIVDDEIQAVAFANGRNGN